MCMSQCITASVCVEPAASAAGQLGLTAMLAHWHNIPLEGPGNSIQCIRQIACNASALHSSYRALAIFMFSRNTSAASPALHHGLHHAMQTQCSATRVLVLSLFLSQVNRPAALSAFCLLHQMLPVFLLLFWHLQGYHSHSVFLHESSMSWQCYVAILPQRSCDV